MSSVPDPAMHKGASPSDSAGAGASSTGTPSGLLRGRANIFGICALAAFVATVGAYLQPVREDPLQPATLWQQLIYPIESNAPFRASDAAKTPWLQDVVVTPDGRAAWAVGQAGEKESDGYLILKSADGGDTWESVARGEVPAPPSPSPASPPEPAKTGADVSANVDLKEQLAAQQQLVDFAGQKGEGKAANMDQQAQVPNQQAQQQTLVPDPKADAQDAVSNTTSSDFDKLGGLHAIWITPDGQRGWAVGASGLILRTEDSGKTWSREESGTSADLVTVSFGDSGEQGWAAGYGAVLARAGSTWRQNITTSAAWIRLIAQRDGSTARGLAADCVAMTFTPDGAYGEEMVAKSTDCLDLAMGHRDGVYVVALTSQLIIWPSFDIVETSSPVSAAAMSDDASRIWYGTRTGSIFSRPIEKGEWTELLRRDGESIARLAVSQSGERLAALSGRTIVTSADGGKTWHEPEYRRNPAPWLYLSWLGIFGAGFLRVRAEEQALEEKADEAIAPEIEADAPALKLADDRLAFRPIIEILAKFLRNTGTKPPLTIAIDGEWGSGKTSMMRMLQGELRSLGFPTVWFNPWHHQKEDVMLAALLQHIRTEGVPFPLNPRGLRYRRRLIAGRILAHPFATTLILIGLLTPIFYFVRHNPGDVLGYFERIIKPAVGLITALIPPSAESAQQIADSLADPGLWFAVAFVFAAFFLVNGLRSFPLSPAALLATLNSKFSAQSAENQTDFRRRFGETFAMVTAALSPRPMVIFIDDLDRCLPEKALETLEATNYLASCGQCFTVLGMARARVERLIGLASERLAAEMAEMEGSEYRRIHKESDPQRELRRNYARRYLEKLVQLNVRVPSSDGRQLMRLLNAEAGEAETASRRDPIRLVRRGWAYGGFAVVLACAGVIAYGLAAYDWPSLQPPARELAATQTQATASPSTPESGSSAAADQAPTTVAPTPRTAPPAPALVTQSDDSGIAYWPILLLAGIVVYLLYRASLSEDAPINETPYYLRAIDDWNGVVVSRQRSPRSVKLFGNLARYTAMMLLEPEARRKLVAPRLPPLFGGKRTKPTTDEAEPTAPSTAAHERDCVAVALAAIYHVRPDILEGSSNVTGPDWERALDAMRASDEDRYHQRLLEIRGLLESRAAVPGAQPVEPTKAELKAIESQALADPELREELIRLKSRQAATDAIAETIRRLPDYYGAWPPSEDIVQRFRLFVMGSVQVERVEESSAA